MEADLAVLKEIAPACGTPVSMRWNYHNFDLAPQPIRLWTSIGAVPLDVLPLIVVSAKVWYRADAR